MYRKSTVINKNFVLNETNASWRVVKNQISWISLNPKPQLLKHPPNYRYLANSNKKKHKERQLELQNIWQIFNLSVLFWIWNHRARNIWNLTTLLLLAELELKYGHSIFQFNFFLDKIHLNLDRKGNKQLKY